MLEVVCRATPTSIGELVSREQAVGYLQSLRESKSWFDARITELTEMLKEYD